MVMSVFIEIVLPYLIPIVFLFTVFLFTDEIAGLLRHMMKVAKK